MDQIFTTFSAEETRALGRSLAQNLKPGLILLSGDLGAGKTAFASGILEGLGAEGPYQSPTFVLMTQYDLPVPKNKIERVYHADAYRVEAKDFETIGFEEWINDPNGITLLEWPERVTEILPTHATSILLKAVSETERNIIIREK